MQEEFNSQVLDPYRRIGMTQVSKMLDPERGLIKFTVEKPRATKTKKSSSGLKDINSDGFTCLQRCSLAIVSQGI